MNLEMEIIIYKTVLYTTQQKIGNTQDIQNCTIFAETRRKIIADKKLKKHFVAWDSYFSMFLVIFENILSLQFYIFTILHMSLKRLHCFVPRLCDRLSTYNCFNNIEAIRKLMLVIYKDDLIRESYTRAIGIFPSDLLIIQFFWNFLQNFRNAFQNGFWFHRYGLDYASGQIKQIMKTNRVE